MHGNIPFMLTVAPSSCSSPSGLVVKRRYYNKKVVSLNLVTGYWMDIFHTNLL